MHKICILSIILLASCTLHAEATEVEIAPAPIVVTPAGSTHYNTTGIQIGQYLYEYQQGASNVADASCSDPNNDPITPDQGDKIIAYRAPLTNGVPGAFERVGRISPCVKSPTCTPFAPYWDCTATRWPPVSMGPGQVFVAKVGGQIGYHLLADASDTLKFRTVWHGFSTDGINWTWSISGQANSSKTENVQETGDAVAHTIQSQWSAQAFFSATDGSGVALLNPILLSSASHTDDAHWWGFFNTGAGVSAMRVDWTGVTAQVSVLSGTSPSWSYTPLSAGSLGFAPTILYPGANVKTLLAENGQYQLWGAIPYAAYGSNVSCDTNTSLMCTQTGGCQAGDGTVVAHNQNGRPFWLNTGPAGDVTCPTCNGSTFAWWPVAETSFGSLNLVYSQIRSMPSGYDVARMFPFRWDSPGGQRYLFSATNDAHICSEFLFSSFFKMYVVRTQLSNQ